MSDLPSYLDYNATTPVDARVLEAMLPYLREHYGNPSSAHVYGRRAHAAVEAARREVAGLIGAAPEEIIFTGCATEANNLAILGCTLASAGSKHHVITSAVEHPSVLQPVMRLRQEGREVTVLPVDGEGQVAASDVARALRPDTALVSVMHANNETGAMQPVADIAALLKPHGIPLHSDAAQSAGKIPVSVDDLQVDLLTLAGHKFYAPKGVGALYVRNGTPLLPIMAGAGHEKGLRPGTESVPLIVGLGRAARLALDSLNEESARLRTLRDELHQRLAEAIPGLMLNGPRDARLPNTLNVSFPRVAGWQLLDATTSVAASTGSACHAADGGSPVLAAMGLSPERIAGAVRLSVGRPSDSQEIARAADALIAAWRKFKTQ